MDIIYQILSQKLAAEPMKIEFDGWDARRMASEVNSECIKALRGINTLMTDKYLTDGERLRHIRMILRDLGLEEAPAGPG